MLNEITCHVSFDNFELRLGYTHRITIEIKWLDFWHLDRGGSSTLFLLPQPWAVRRGLGGISPRLGKAGIP